MSVPRTITRTVTLAFAVAATLSLGSASTARASDVSYDKAQVVASYAALLKMKPMDVMHRMDTEKTGFVTKEQFMKFHESMFDNMDKNKDGKLSREEWLGQIHP